MCKFDFDFRKMSPFISKNTIPKVTLKYQVSMLTCPSAHSTYPKIDFRIMRTVNRLSQLNINRKFQKYISVSICYYHKASFMRSLFIAFKSDEWCHFVVRFDSPALISFYCVCVISFYFSPFSYFFRVLYYLLKYGGKFNNTYNKGVKLFLGS